MTRTNEIVAHNRVVYRTAIQIMLISAQGTGLRGSPDRMQESPLRGSLSSAILCYVSLLTGYVSYLAVAVTRHGE